MSQLSAEGKLSGAFLEDLVAEFTDPGIVGFMLTGSFARGEATRYSDVDLMKFVDELPESESERYIVRFREEHLVCVKVATVGSKLDELRRPETAIWAVPGLRQAVVLSDPKGELSELKSKADAFDWKDLQPSADLYAANELAGFSEEVHKVLKARPTGDSAAADYAILGLLLGLTRLVAAKLGVMIATENAYLRLVREAVGSDSIWSEYQQRISSGGSLEERMTAALGLYVATSELIDGAGRAADIEVVNETVRRINNFQENNT